MFYGVVYEITNSKTFEFFHELPSREKEQQRCSNNKALVSNNGKTIYQEIKYIVLGEYEISGEEPSKLGKHKQTNMSKDVSALAKTLQA